MPKARTKLDSDTYKLFYLGQIWRGALGNNNLFSETFLWTFSKLPQSL